MILMFQKSDLALVYRIIFIYICWKTLVVPLSQRAHQYQIPANLRRIVKKTWKSGIWRNKLRMYIHICIVLYLLFCWLSICVTLILPFSNVYVYIYIYIHTSYMITCVYIYIYIYIHMYNYAYVCIHRETEGDSIWV